MFFSLISAVLVMSSGYDLYYYLLNKGILVVLTLLVQHLNFFVDVPNQLWQTFSIFHNGKKLFRLSKPTKEHLQVIHGVRVISTMWIVIGHTFQFQETFPVTNQQFVIDVSYAIM